MIKVLKSGFFTTVQDLGRVGGREFGVPSSGCMDQYSSKLANALLGNNLNNAVLEFTLIGPTLQFKIKTSICITGANMNAKLNNVPVTRNQPISVQPDDTLSFGKLESGCRAYMSVLGGFQTEVVMNSRSMYPNVTRAAQIHTGDELPLLANDKAVIKTNSVIRYDSNLFSEVVLKAYKGPEFDLLSKRLQSQLMSKEFTVSKNNNRMGYQLEEGLENNLKGTLTAPVLPGTVQLTPSGKLIVLMRDGQTTGGYPRVLQLKHESINVLGQKKVGDFIKFQF